ncbi:MAG: DUF4157 domain-containing protein, partial [bacterium]
RNRESGRPLVGLLRHQMERKVGMNLANVRIHTNAETARQLRRAGADALTVGDQVYFAPGKYDPESRRGRALLVHELTHVRQQQEIADSGAWLSPTRMQHFEQQAQHNERETLQRSDNLPLAGDPAIGSHAPAPVLFNPAMYGLAQNRSGGATGQNIQNAPPAMAAASDRNLDTGPVGVPLAAETALSEQDAFAETATRTEEIYDALKWQLKIERERSGD